MEEMRIGGCHPLNQLRLDHGTPHQGQRPKGTTPRLAGCQTETRPSSLRVDEIWPRSPAIFSAGKPKAPAKDCNSQPNRPELSLSGFHSTTFNPLGTWRSLVSQSIAACSSPISSTSLS